MYFCAIWV